MKNKIKIIMLFVINISIAINSESSTNLYWSVSITNYYDSIPIIITPTNLVARYPSDETSFMVSFDRWDYSINKKYYYPKPNDDVIITTNRITEFNHGVTAIAYKFTPVSFTNDLIGFRVDHHYVEGMKFRDSTKVKYIKNSYYVALSDTLVEVGEEDVERELLKEDDD